VLRPIRGGQHDEQRDRQKSEHRRHQSARKQIPAAEESRVGNQGQQGGCPLESHEPRQGRRDGAEQSEAILRTHAQEDIMSQRFGINPRQRGQRVEDRVVNDPLVGMLDRPEARDAQE
jgi:hypothetical protein